MSQPAIRRILAAAAGGIAVVTLAACGGGSSSGGNNASYTPPGPPNPFSDSPTNAWVVADYTGKFDSSQASTYFNSPEYAFINNDGGSPTASEYFGNAFTGYRYNGNAYHVVRLHTAHGAGLSGNGLYVAIVDNGFRLSHEAFSGKTIDVYGNAYSVADHGTHVAGLVGANPATSEMRGVAYDANLHLTSTDTWSVSPGELAKATLEAANLGAVAQNNSWGYTSSGAELALQDVQKYMHNNNIGATETALTSLIGASGTQWRQYFDALETFQDSGVIVWALSNDESIGGADATAGLPILVPDLQGAWITVANGIFDLDSNLDITRASLLSAPCGQTAQFCLTASGTTGSASGTGNKDYEYGTGTSYAAPIVSGAVALVAEAFPSLSPEEWTKRLLASAYSDFSAFSADGTTNFGNGVKKYYSETWGQGVLDLEAALSPIGTVSMVSGRNVNTGTRSALSSSYLGGGGAFGDGLSRGLEGTEIAVFDALNGDFYIDGSMLARDNTDSVGQSAAIPRLDAGGDVDKLDLGAWGLAAENEITFDDFGYTFGLAAVGGSEYLQDVLGLSSANVENASVLSLADDTTAVYGRYDMGFADFEHYGFIGTHDSQADGSVSGVGAALAFDFDAFGLTLGASQISERGGYLGMTASDVFADSQGTAISALNLSGSADLGETFTLFGGLEYGLASGATGAGYLTALDDATFTGFQLGVTASELWLDADTLTLTASQPLRVETGTMTLDIPTGRRPNGDIVYDTITSGLAPSGRQLDLGVSYAFEPNALGLLELGFVYSLDAGHVAGAEAAAIGATFTQGF